MRHVPEENRTDELAVFASSCSAGRIALSRSGDRALVAFGRRAHEFEEPPIEQLYLVDVSTSTATRLPAPSVEEAGSSLAGFGKDGEPILIRDEWTCSLLQTLLSLEKGDDSCSSSEFAYEWRTGWVRLRDQSDPQPNVPPAFARSLASFAEIRNHTLPNVGLPAWDCATEHHGYGSNSSCVLVGPSIRITRTRTNTCTGSYAGPVMVEGFAHPAFAAIGPGHEVEADGDIVLITSVRRERPLLLDAQSGRVLFQATNGLGAMFWPDPVHPLDR